MPLKCDDVFRRLAIEAGAAIMEIYESGDMGVEAKSDDSPVTLADLAADKSLHVIQPGKRHRGGQIQPLGRIAVGPGL